MATNCAPGWATHKRTKFETGAGDQSEGEDTSLPGVTFLSDLLKGIDVKRQTGYTDADLPQPFKMTKSYAHVPHEYLAPDGFPKPECWLDPACKYAILSEHNRNEGKGGVVRRALDLYREQGKQDVPSNPPLATGKIRRTPKTRHIARAKKNQAAKGTDQSTYSANRINKTYDSERYRVNDPVLPYEDYERTMDIIHHTYKIITHGKGQFVDRTSHELIFTYSFEDLEEMTPEMRDEHQDDVSTILKSTKLFKRLPTPKPLMTPTFRSERSEIPAVHSPLPATTDSTKVEMPNYANLPSSPLSSLPPSDAQDYEQLKLDHLDTTFQPVDTNQASSPLTSLPPSDSEEVTTKSNPKKRKRGDVLIVPVNAREGINPSLNSKRRKRTITTNGALIHGRMHCFGQTVGYSNNILTSPYIPPKGTSRSLYKGFLDKLPVLGAHIGGRFQHFCDVGFQVAREQLNHLHAPPLASTSEYQPSGPLDFSANFAFTLGNFYNKPHTDNDKGKVYCLWYPIDCLSGRIVTESEGFDMEGGWFIFPEYRVAFKFGGKCAVQIAWNGKTTFHHTIPSKEHIQLNKQGEQVHYTRLGCSSQITYKIARASVKIGTDEQWNHTSNCERKVRDVEDFLKLKDRNWKK